MDWVDKNRTRTPKKSALVYKEIIRSRVLDYDYNPNPYKVAVSVKADEKTVPDAAITHTSKIFIVTYILIVLFNLLT